MQNIITCYIPYNGDIRILTSAKKILADKLVAKVYLLVADKKIISINEFDILKTKNYHDAETVKQIAETSRTKYSLIISGFSPVEFEPFAIQRFFDIAESTEAGLLYSDYWIEDNNNSRKPFKVNELQKGSIRDDFNFGHVYFYRSKYIRQYIEKIKKKYRFAAMYALRLLVMRKALILKIPEFSYFAAESNDTLSASSIFDYVNPGNKERQLEMEHAVTRHLEKTGAYLSPFFKEINPDTNGFEYEASVIIPLKNRVKTIEQAIHSALAQKAGFKYNVIIIDNHSTDGSTKLIRKMAETDQRVVHIVPENKFLGIGGCWTLGIHHEKCGKFACQLDSDDLYKNENTLQKIADKFYAEKCAMVIGSYETTDFMLQSIPPGIVDHDEWTAANGRNNALRINGFGAPRAFFTPVLRKLNLPNVSYGEDYATCLAISRTYKTGRIFESLYICRRWDDNTDNSLDMETANRYNAYKDTIRTYEILARQHLNKN